MNLTSITSRQNNGPSIPCNCYLGLVGTWFCWVKKKKERKKERAQASGREERRNRRRSDLVIRHTHTQSGVPCRLVFPLAFSSPSPSPREVAEHPTQHACLPSSRSSLPSPSPSSSSSSPPSPSSSSSSSSEESAPAAGPQFVRDPSIRFDLPRVWLDIAQFVLLLPVAQGNLNAGESVITVEGHGITLPGHHRKFWEN